MYRKTIQYEQGEKMKATLIDIFRAMKLEQTNYKTIIFWQDHEKYEIKVRRLE